MHGKFWPNKLLNIGVAAILIAASTGALAGNVANAQIPGVQTGKIETPLIEELIVYGSRTQTAASALPGSAYKIGTEDLALTRHRHIADSLVRVPGVWLSRGNGQEHLTALRSPVLTGAGACGAFLMAEDNIPLRAAGFCNVNQLFEATSELAGRIEVLSGPQSVLYGSNALHGVINVVSLPYQGSSKASTTLALEGGGYDYYRTRLSHQNSKWYAGFDGVRSGGYKDYAGFDQQKLKLRHRTKTTWRSGELNITTTAALTNLNQETAGFITGNDAYQDDSRKQENPNPEAYRDARSQRLNIRFDYQPNDATQWVFTPYVRYTEMEFLMHFLPWRPVEKNRHYSAGWQGMVRHRLNQALTFNLGLDGEYTQGELQEVQTTGFTSSIPAGVHYDYRVSAKVLSPFAMLTWQVNKRTQLSAGLRYEWLNYNYDNRAGSLSPCASGVACRFSRPEDTSDSYNNASWQVGLVREFAIDHQLYINLSRGYRAPQATELYRLQSGQIGTELDAETADNIELGLRGKRGHWRYTFASYRMEKDEVIFQNSDRQNLSGASTLHRGVELALHWLPESPWYFDVNASYAKHSYSRNVGVSEISIKGKDIDTAPRYIASVRVGRRFAGNSLFGESHAELEWVYMGSYYTDSENQHSYRGHRLFNVRWQWQLTSHWQLGVRINNLQDTDYADRADYGFGQERYFVGEPRAGFLDLSWQY